MDILYIAILLAFCGLTCVLALGCAHLQKRKAGMHPCHDKPTVTSAASLG